MHCSTFEAADLSKEISFDALMTGNGSVLELGDYEGGVTDEYKYMPSGNDMDYYDFESPYWKPSSEKRMLLAQIRKLGILSISPKELRYINHYRHVPMVKCSIRRGQI